MSLRKDWNADLANVDRRGRPTAAQGLRISFLLGEM